MPAPDSATAAADEVFRAFLRHCLAVAAKQFELTIGGEPTFGWRLRTIGCRAHHRTSNDDTPVWLRVVSQETEWERGPAWTGAVEADQIQGVAKPHVLDVYEWVEQSWRIQRAEVSTLMPGQPCSSEPAPRKLSIPPSTWWADLRRSFIHIAHTPTTRSHADQTEVDSRIRARFGPHVDTTVTAWETVHGDMHWANLMEPNCAVLDWELWGTAPAGTDAASLLCHSLLTPELARHVEAVFADKLAGKCGLLAQLLVIAHLLDRADIGDHPALVKPLRQRADELLGRPLTTDSCAGPG
jgi:hypothetical protein